MPVAKHKHILCLTLQFLGFYFYTNAQTQYYSKATGNPNNVATWGTNTNGTGTQPANFTAANQVFNLRNANPGSLSANWTVSGAGSKVIVGDGTNVQSLNTGTFTFTGTVDIANNGTFNVQSNSLFTLGSCATGSTVVYSLDTVQSIRAGTYYHLSLTNTTSAVTKTASNTITINGNLLVDANTTFSMSTFALSGVSGTISGTGTILTSNTSSTPIPAGKTWTQNVAYSASGSQTVVHGVYEGNLNVAGGIRTFSSLGTIEVKGNFTANTNTTYTLTGSSFLFSGAAQTLTFRTSTGLTFNNISFTGVNCTKTITGGFGINGTMNVGTTVRLDMVSYVLTGSPTTITGSGTIATQATGTSPIPTGKTWTQTVEYYRLGNQNISGGRYKNLTLINSQTNNRTRTASDSITVDDTLTFNTQNTGALTLAMGVFRLINGGNMKVVNTGTSSFKHVTTSYTNNDTNYTPLPSGQSWAGNVTYNATSHQTVVGGVYGNNLVVTLGPRTFSGIGTIEVKNNFTANTAGMTYAHSGSNFLFSGGAQTLSMNAASPHTFNNLSFTGSDVTKTINGTGFSVNGELNIGSTVTVYLATYVLGGNPTTITGSGQLTTQNTSATPLPANKTWTQTVLYSSNANQTLVAGTYQKLFIGGITSGTRIKTASGNITVNDTFQITTAGGAATIEMGSYKLIDGGAFKLAFFGTNAKSFNTQCLDTLPLPSGVVWSSIGTVNYGATSGVQIVSKGIYYNLTLSGNASKKAEGTITVRGTLSLNSPNLSATKGCLDMGTDTLIMDTPTATFTNAGDVNGLIKRTGPFTAGTAYRFGSQYTRITFAGNGIIPTEICMRISFGDSLSWKYSSVLRQYEIVQIGGTDTATMQFRYLSSELNNNVETRLVIWEDSNGTVVERGRSAINTTNKFVEVAYIPISYYPSVFGTSYTGIAMTAVPKVVWTGATDDVWTTASNWEPTFVPDSLDDVIIPDSATTLNKPTLPATARVNTISIEENAVLNSTGGAQLIIYGGTTLGLSSWDCNGTFNSGTSNVLFLGTDAAYAGTTQFYDVSIASNAILSNRESSVMRIGNTVTNNGIWRVAAFNETTVEYNRDGTQNVLKPNGITVPGYYNLMISGSGTKIFPDTMYIKGDLINTGTITVNSVHFDGSIDQQLSSTTPVSINILRLNNTGNQLLVDNDLTVTDSLNLINGVLNIRGSDLTLSGIVTGSGLISSNDLSDITINGAGNLGTIQFVESEDSVHNFILNRTSSGLTTMGSNMVVAGDLILSNGKLALGANKLILNGGFSGSVSSNLSANGTTSAVYIGGSGTLGDLFFDQSTVGASNRLSTLTYDRNSHTITLGNQLQIADSIVPVAGTLASAGNLVLVSDASKTARIANGNCTTCSYITGNVSVQRFVPALARRWRFLGSPVAGNSVADWQNEIYITGAGGAANGFDATLSNQAGIYYYNEALTTGNLTTGWTSPSNTSQTLGLGRGYRVFVRGDRSDIGRLNGTNTTQNAVTINAVGVPNQGDITMPVSCSYSGTSNVYVDSNDGWNLLANPYASPYDWDAHYNDGSYHTKLDPTIWVYNTQTNGYVSYNATSQDGDLTGGIIPSGASFWVKANTSGPTLTFTEKYKSGATPVSMFKTGNGESFSIKLIYDSLNSDATMIKYMQGVENGFDHYDTRKLEGTVNISTYDEDNVQMALNVRPTTFEVDTIKIKVGDVPGEYKLVFVNSDKLAIKENVWLIDNYMARTIDLRSVPEYQYSVVSGVAASSGANRFYIVVGNSSSLPVKLIQFGARKTKDNKVVLGWSTAQEINNEKFVIERSTDGNKFYPIGEVFGKNGSSVYNYSFTDNTPGIINYYRLKQLDFDGTATYSKTKVVVFGERKNAILNLFPVPAKEIITVNHLLGINSIKIADLTGNTVLEMKTSGKMITINIESLPQGVYTFSVADEEGNTVSEKFIKD